MNRAIIFLIFEGGNMHRRSSEIISRLTTISILSALGFILMAFCRFPYPFAPWLMIEISDLIVLIAYALYGFSGGILTALLKTGLDLLVNGVTGIGGIGNLTALLTSLLLVFFLFLTSHVFKWFKKGFRFRILSYGVIVLSMSILLTFLNFLFITPTYMTGQFTTCFDTLAVDQTLNGFQSMGITNSSYFLLIFIIYFPFNLCKDALICFVYELVFNRLIFVVMNRSPFFKKYFVGSVFRKKEDSEEEKKEEKEEKHEL